MENKRRLLLIFGLIVIGSILVVSAIDFIPQGNINLKGVFNITNLAYVFNFSLAGNINANNYNITGADNISAKHFYGEGSGLTGISSNSTVYWANLSGFVTNYLYRNGLDLDINETRLNNSVIATAARFNETNMIFSVNATGNIQALGFYTKTQVDNNLTLYLLLTDQRFNETSLINSVNTTYNIQRLSFYNKSQIDNNLSLYLLLTDQTYNDTSLMNSINSSLTTRIGSVNNTQNIMALGFYNQTAMDNNLSFYLLSTDQKYNETTYINSNFINNSRESLLNVNSSSWWAGISGFLTTYLFKNGNNLDLNETRLNKTIVSEGISVGFNSTYNATYAAKADYQFTNNNFNGSGNFTTTSGNVEVTNGYLKGQPLKGGMGSGIISGTWTSRAGLNVTFVGLNVSYPAFVVRLIKTDGTLSKECNIPKGSLIAVDNQFSVYYIDQNCAIQSQAFTSYESSDVSPGGVTSFMYVMAHSGSVETIMGTSLLGKIEIKDRQIIMKVDNMRVVSGFVYNPEGAWPNFTIQSGEYQFIRDIVPTSTQNISLTGDLELVGHNKTGWQFHDQKGLNVTTCDNGTGINLCTGNQWRRHFVFVVGYNNSGADNTELHQLYPLESVTYSSAANCINTLTFPLQYSLPPEYLGSSVMIFAYCSRRTDTSWTASSFIDLRTTKTGTASTPAEIDPVWTADKSNYYTIADSNSVLQGNLSSLNATYLNLTGTNANQNLNIGAFNLTSTGSLFFNFLGSISSRISKLFVTSVDISGDVNMSSVNGKICSDSACTTFSNATGSYFNNGVAYIIYNGTNMVLKG